MGCLPDERAEWFDFVVANLRLEGASEEVVQDLFWLGRGASLDELSALDDEDGVWFEYELVLLYSFEILEAFGE